MHSFTHAANALDLASVLELIAAKCVNARAKAAIRSIQPTTATAHIRTSIHRILDLRTYEEAHGRVPVIDSGSRDIVASALEDGGAIAPDGLLVVAAAERSVIELQRRVHGAEARSAALDGLVARFVAHKGLVDSIARTIETDGSIRDDASTDLRRLRKAVHRAKGDIRDYTERAAKDFGSSEYVTFTGNRFMLVLPREKCKQREGIVHSTSHSGGSLYFEPLTLVAKNNKLETLNIDVRAEEARILAELTQEVLEASATLLGNAAVWDELDVLCASARFAAEFDCTSPVIDEAGAIYLKTARHPLLEVNLRGTDRKPIPLDIELVPGARVLVITGPNAGGKTVTLKTVGLLSLMFQCGLPVPAVAGSRLAIFERVLVDIGDEQSIAASLSTFTSHLKHLDAMCRVADDRTLCLVDEIGDGTDPDEGAALAVATLERLLSAGAAVIATTHYGKIKSFALQTQGVSNASMLFDDQSGDPLYRLLQGTAGRSRGVETARRVGFHPGVIERAQELVGEATFRLENLLGELESSQLSIERERAALREQSDALQRLVDSYDQRERELRDFRDDHRDRARREAEELLVRARREIEDIVKTIRETQAGKAAVREGHQRLRQLMTETAPPATAPPALRADTVVVGDRVSLNENGEPAGEVISVQGAQATVEFGGTRLTVAIDRLYEIAGESEPRTVRSGEVSVSFEPMQSTTIDVRGETREVALEQVDLFLDRAVLNGVQEVKIIHGVGQGVLVEAIRDSLRGDLRVRSTRPGQGIEGGAGVSFVQLK